MKNQFNRHSPAEFPATLTLILIIYVVAIHYVGVSAGLRTIQKITSQYDLDWLTWRRCEMQRGRYHKPEPQAPSACDFGSCLLED